MKLLVHLCLLQAECSVAAPELPLLSVRVQGAELLGLSLCSMQVEGTAPQPAEGCLVAAWD